MKANPHLVSMVIVGSLFFVAGVIVTALGFRAVRDAPTADALAAWPLVLGLGSSLAGFGLTVLMIAWIIAAAKWQRS